MTPSAQRLMLRAVARDVASWLQQTVPEGFAVQAVECGIVLRAPEIDEGRTVDLSPLLHLDDDDRTVIETAVLRMLDDVQDEVIETVRGSWPSAAGRAEPASAYVEWHDEALSIGYRYDPGTVVAGGVVATNELWR